MAKYSRYLTNSELAHMGAFLMFNSHHFKKSYDENPDNVHAESLYVTNATLRYLFHPSNNFQIKITVEGDIDKEKKKTLLFHESYLKELDEKLSKERDN